MNSSTARHGTFGRPCPTASLLWILFFLACSSVVRVESFQMVMRDYRPPVKSSVSKLQGRRRTGDSSSRSTSSAGGPNGPTGTSKAAHAATFHPPPSSSSPFERRMRDLVLNNQRRRSVKEQTHRRRARDATLPPNVQIVDNLREYKQVVGDETTKMVAVRFYAPWCRVSGWRIVWRSACRCRPPFISDTRILFRPAKQ